MPQEPMKYTRPGSSLPYCAESGSRIVRDRLRAFLVMAEDDWGHGLTADEFYALVYGLDEIAGLVHDEVLERPSVPAELGHETRVLRDCLRGYRTMAGADRWGHGLSSDEFFALFTDLEQIAARVCEQIESLVSAGAALRRAG